MNTIFSTTSSGWRNCINQMMDFCTFTIWLLAMIWTASPWSLTWALCQSGSSRISSEALLRILSKRCEIPKWFSANSPQHRELFARAKGEETDSFLKNEAVKACHRTDEVHEAMGSGCVVRARWVLTWKLVRPEDQVEACQDAANNPSSTHTHTHLHLHLHTHTHSLLTASERQKHVLCC